MKYLNICIDRLCGPSYFFAGLSHGNQASRDSQFKGSSPQKAALQGLEKMKLVASLGVPQYVLPPLKKPSSLFSSLFPKSLINKSNLKYASYTSAEMWMANAGLFTPHIDSTDNKAHFTPANLASNLHRFQESEETYRFFLRYFSPQVRVHTPLPAPLLDEGAANHMRLSPDPLSKGLHIFVYNYELLAPGPNKRLGRQALESFQSLIKQHRLDPGFCLCLEQNRKAVEAGVFHHDVIGMSHQKFLCLHEDAFEDPAAIQEISSLYQSLFKKSLDLKIISRTKLSIAEAVDSYFFNSQCVDLGDNKIGLVLPEKCKRYPAIERLVYALLHEDRFIHEVFYLDLEQSMANGGGPACLRLRMLVSEETGKKMAPFILNYKTYNALKNMIINYYPKHLEAAEIGTASFFNQLSKAYAAIETIFFK